MCSTVGHSWSVPNAAPRASSVPCHIGVIQATGRTHAGSWLIGKNVPANSDNGTTTNRNTTLNAWPLLRTVAANAISGAPNASPVSTPNTSDSRMPGPLTAPIAAATTRYAALDTVSRADTHNSRPLTIWAGVIGVAVM